MPGQSPADWYPDPFGRHEHRYWDGTQWTHHVALHGRQATDPPIDGPPGPAVNRTSMKLQRQLRRSGVPQVAQVGDAALFTEPVLVVNQKAKLFGINNEYAVYDQQGQRIGAVREVDQRLLKKAMGGGGEHGTRRFQVVDMNGRVLITLTRPAKFLKSKMIVRGANGTNGGIMQKNIGIIGNVHFRLESGGQPLGFINAEDWRGWDFNIHCDRNRERTYHQDLSRVGQGEVHEGRQLRRADSPAAGGPFAFARDRGRAGYRYRAQAGRSNPRFREYSSVRVCARKP